MSPFKIPAFFDLHLMRPNPEKASMACCLQRSRSLVFFNSWYFLNCSDAVYFEPFPLTVMLPASFVKITFCCSIYSFPSTAFSIPVLKPAMKSPNCYIPLPCHPTHACMILDLWMELMECLLLPPVPVFLQTFLVLLQSQHPNLHKLNPIICRSAL